MNFPTRLATNVAQKWNDLPVNRKLVAAAIGTGAAVTLGTVAAGRRDSVPAQALAYGSVFATVAAVPVWAAGRAAVMTAARRTAAMVGEGALDEAAAAASMLEVKTRAMRPAKVLLAGGLGAASGVLAGNATYSAAQGATLRYVSEQEAMGRSAAAGAKK